MKIARDMFLTELTLSSVATFLLPGREITHLGVVDWRCRASIWSRRGPAAWPARDRCSRRVAKLAADLRNRVVGSPRRSLLGDRIGAAMDYDFSGSAAWLLGVFGFASPDFAIGRRTAFLPGLSAWARSAALGFCRGSLRRGMTSALAPPAAPALRPFAEPRSSSRQIELGVDALAGTLIETRKSCCALCASSTAWASSSSF